MERINPFDGKCTKTKFAWKIYNRLMSREWFSYEDIMYDYLKDYKKQYNKTTSLSKCDNYGELKKAFCDLRKLLDKDIEPDGNNRNKKFRYIGKDKDPLEDYKNAVAINDIKKYAQFCYDSAGFFPSSWLEHFFEETLDLLTINRCKQNGEQMIISSVDRELSNIDLLPKLYENIRDKQVLQIDYKPYDEETVTIIFHPHLLKEYNGRWFLFGHAENMFPELGYNLALDRVVSYKEKTDSIYIPAPKGFYSEFFKNIVGVSHLKDSKPERIVVRALNHRIYKLTETKPIHHSQKVIKPFALYEDGEYGELELFIELNNEFLGRILQMGNGVVVVAPQDIRNKFKNVITSMTKLYD